MKKLLFSLATVAIVVTGGVYATRAFFSDVEKSSGNTFSAGILDLKIDSDCSYNGKPCICPSGWTYCYWDQDNSGTIVGDEVTEENRCSCKWDERDLTSEKFFDFANLLPGDQGEATISMHVIGDDAYVRTKIDNIWNKDNGCNDPETEAGDHSCGDWGGELGENMTFVLWADMGSVWGYQNDPGEDPEEGDNILNTLYEYGTMEIGDGNKSAGKWVYPGFPLRDCTTYYFGTAWCVGTMTVHPGTYAMICDGSTADNIIQTDSYSSDVTYEVQQVSNNPTPTWVD